MFYNKKTVSFITFLILSLSLLWIFNATATGNDDTYYKIDKGLFYLKQVFETLSRNYVDELDPEGLSKSAINGMLEDFDPYTVFYEDPGSQNLNMITRGKYGGVGMEIGIQEGEITVIAPMENTPAKRAGIQSGDIILKIDGIPTSTLSLEETSQKLRGKIGTEVTLEIKRPMTDKPIKLTLEREEIVINDVTFAEFIEPGTAFIRLSRFSDKAGRELKDAIRQLQAEQPIERFILDLRRNPGGLLTAAVDVANVFVEPGQLIVSTHGSKEKETKFFADQKPMLPDQNLVVLINQYSASASEIVAGAIQDLDRGVLVGEPSFGKGLVQKVYPIDKISQAYLKVTTAKYYIPSGRSIQKEDYKKNKSVFIDLSDSVEYNTHTKYRTKNGRIVNGGGGIKPDIEVSNGGKDPVLNALAGQGYFFRFAVDYLSQHPGMKNSGMVTLNDTIVNEFIRYVKEQDFSLTLDGEKELEDFLEIAEEKEYNDDIRDLVTVALQKLNYEKKAVLERKKEKIRQMLEGEFAEKIQDSRARIRTMLKYDEQTKAALQVLHNMDRYHQILAIK
ncbi:MAG: S41 family peptidase [Calditrichia bacterium]